MVKLTAIKDAEKFLSVLEKSELFSPDQLEQVRSTAKGMSPQAVARNLIQDGRLTKWQAKQLLVGGYLLKLGKYELLEQLGSGELGRVYLANHSQMGRRVAIKTLSRQFTSDPAKVKQFLNEARNAAALDHRNIVHVFDIDSEKERYYIVMEFVNGRSLQKAIDDDGPLSTESIARFLRQAAEGIAYAHQQGMVHRNINPTSILLDTEGVLKILDFGVSRLTDETGEDSADVNYRSLEVASGRDGIDIRADIYSLGCVAYFMATGRAPQAARKRDPKVPLDIRKYRGDATPELVKVIHKLTSVSRKGRFQSPESLLKTLDQWLEILKKLEANSNGKATAKALPAKAKRAAGGSGKLPQAKPLDEDIPVAIATNDDDAQEGIPEKDTISIATADATTPAAAPGAFQIDATPKKGGAAPAVVSTKSKPRDSGEVAAAPAARKAVGKKQLEKKHLILFGAVGTGVLALAMVMGFVLFGGPSTDELAQKDG